VTARGEARMTTDQTPTLVYSDPTPATDIAVVRRTLRRLTFYVTAVVMISIPALFGAAGFRALHERAVLEASVTAERLVDYALAAGSDWTEARGGAQGAMNIVPAVGAEIERTLIGPEGKILIAPLQPVDRPTLTASAPVVVYGRRTAEVVVAVSLRPILAETALVTLFAALVAAGLYLVIDRVALRALRQALDHLQSALRERDRALEEGRTALSQLARQNARLKTASEELARARDAALTADRSKSMFLAAMSHELRTPLNAIIGFSEVMARQLYGPIGHEKYRDYASDIRASGDHLLALIDDVLDLSRVEAGKLALRREPLGVVEQITSCCRLIQGRADDSGISLRLDDADQAEATILGDRVRFRQILLNLLTNAVKFTDRGGTVRIGVDLSGPRSVVIRISDTGIGMSEQDLERVLRPFERGDVRTSRPTEGAGLGLALSRALVREHDGTLHIASAAGRGTTVTLSFPRLLGREGIGRETVGQRGQMSLDDALRDEDPGAPKANVAQAER